MIADIKTAAITLEITLNTLYLEFHISINKNSTLTPMTIIKIPSPTAGNKFKNLSIIINPHHKTESISLFYNLVIIMYSILLFVHNANTSKLLLYIYSNI